MAVLFQSKSDQLHVWRYQCVFYSIFVWWVGYF